MLLVTCECSNCNFIDGTDLLRSLALGSHGGMAEYRAYIIGGDGHFAGFESLVCDDDAVAIEKAERLVDGHDIELWSGKRLVKVLKHAPDEGQPSSPSGPQLTS